jgi:hypothetical protein
MRFTFKVGWALNQHDSALLAKTLMHVKREGAVGYCFILLFKQILCVPVLPTAMNSIK